MKSVHTYGQGENLALFYDGVAWTWRMPEDKWARLLVMEGKRGDATEWGGHVPGGQGEPLQKVGAWEVSAVLDYLVEMELLRRYLGLQGAE